MEEFRFDGWTLKRDSGELTRDGRTSRLPPQPFQILDALLSRPGEVVGRDELVAKLWPKGVVDFDTALNTAVRRLRTALGDAAETPRYIETIPRRGYRFVGRVERAVAALLPETTAEPSPTVPGNAGAAAPVVATVETPRLRPPVNRWLPVALAMLGIAGVSIAWLRPSAAPPSGADNASQAADALVRPMSPESFATQHPDAAERYQRARFLLKRRSDGDLARAKRHLAEVIALVPEYAPAHAALAGVHFLQAVQGEVERGAGLEYAEAAAQRALSLDPRQVEALLRLANHAAVTGQPALRDERIRQAVALEPQHAMALAFRASIALSENRLDESIELSRRAIAADPLSLSYRYNHAVALYAAGRHAEARRALHDLAELAPAYRGDLMAQLLILDGRYAEVLEMIRSWRDDAAKLQCLALAYHGLGRRRDADDALQRLIVAHGRYDPLRIAEVYAYRGEHDRAFEWLARQPERRDVPVATRPVAPRELHYSAFAAALRADARWQQWAARTG